MQVHFVASTFPLYFITRNTSYIVLVFKKEKQLHFTAISSSSSCLARNSGSSSARDMFVARSSAKYFQALTIKLLFLAVNMVVADMHKSEIMK